MQFGSLEKLSLKPYHEQFCPESLARKYLTTLFDHFMPLVHWEHKKTSAFFMFAGAIERNQCHDMDWSDKKEAKIRTWHHFLVLKVWFVGKVFKRISSHIQVLFQVSIVVKRFTMKSTLAIMFSSRFYKHFQKSFLAASFLLSVTNVICRRWNHESPVNFFLIHINFI